MRKANELFNKPLITHATGERVGTVYDLILDADARHVVALLLDGGSWFRDAKIVRWSSINSIADVIIIKSPESVVSVKEDSEVAGLIERPQRLTGTSMISESGEQIGKVGDLFIDDAGAVVGYEVKTGFINDLAGRKFLPVDAIQAVGQDAVVAADSSLTTVKEHEKAVKNIEAI